jgi:hypothetical protein
VGYAAGSCFSTSATHIATPCMLEACPGAYFWIGTDGETPSKPLHNASYDFNDALIPQGARALPAAAAGGLRRRQLFLHQRHPHRHPVAFSRAFMSL